jgi:hypothetical protein
MTAQEINTQHIEASDKMFSAFIAYRKSILAMYQGNENHPDYIELNEELRKIKKEFFKFDSIVEATKEEIL